MSKFTKVFLSIVLALLVALGITLGIFYCIMPTETRCAIDIVVYYLNQPLGVVCGTTITLGLVLAVIGKIIYDIVKDNIKEQLQEVKNFNANKVVEAKEFYDKALQEKEEIKAILGAYQSEIDTFIEKLVKVCETSPNAKVKALAEEVKYGSETIKQNLNKEIEKINKDYVSVVQEHKSIEELEKQISELNKKFESMVEKYGE